MENLKLLLQQTLEPDDEVVRQAGNALLELYSQPETVFYLISLYQEVGELSIRKAISIALKSSLTHCWEVIRNEHAAQVQNSLLEMISVETDIVCQHVIIDAISQIFCTDGTAWDGIVEFTNNLSEAHIELYLSLYTAMIPYLPGTAIGSSFEVLCSQALDALGSQIPDLIITGSKLCATLLETVSTTEQQTALIYHSMIDSFYNSLANESSYYTFLLNDLVKFINKTDQFEEPQEMITQLCALCLDEQIQIQYRIIASELICTVLKKYPNITQAVARDLISLTLMMGANSFIDDCYEQQQDIIFVIKIIECVCRFVPPADFYEVFWEYVNTETPGHIVTASAALASTIEYIPEIVSIHFEDLFQFAIECLHDPHHCVEEAAIAILYELILRHNNMFTNYYETFLQAIFDCLGSQHLPLILSAVAALTELLFVTEIPDGFLISIFQQFNILAQSLEVNNLHLVISGFAALCRSAGDSSVILANELLPVLIKASSLEGNELIKPNTMEALAYLILNAPHQTTSIHQDAFNMFIGASQSEDIFLFTSSMISIETVAKSEVFSLDIEQVVPSIFNVLQINLNENDFDKGSAVHSSYVEAQKSALDMLYTMIKYQAQYIQPHIELLIPVLENLFEYSEPAIQKSSIRSLIAISKATGQLTPTFMEKLMAHFEENEKETTILAFYGMTKLLITDLVKNEGMNDFIKHAFDYAIQGLNLQLSCQGHDQSETLELELSDYIFNMLASLAQYRPDLFILSEFWETTQLFKELDQKDSFIECIGVLVEYYASNCSQIPSLYVKTVEQEFWESFAFCDMEVPAYPIAAVRCMIENTNTVTKEQVNSIIDIASDLLDAEFNGQPYYWTTIANVVSLLFTVIRICNLEEFRLFAKMIQSIPLCLCEAEVNNILSTLCIVSGNLISAVQDDVIRAITETLSMKSLKWRKLKLSDNTLVSIISLLKNLVSNSSSGNQVIAAVLGDGPSNQRFQERFQNI